MYGTNFGVVLSSVMTGWFGEVNKGYLFVTANTTPEATANLFQKGCICLETTAGTLYQNTGTFASPTWSVNGTGASGASGASGSSGVSGATVSGASGASGFSGASGASGVSGV